MTRLFECLTVALAVLTLYVALVVL